VCAHTRRQRLARGRRRPGGSRTSAREERDRPVEPAEGHGAGWPVGQCGGEGRWAVARLKGRMGRLGRK
jgi:hypothetical protein